MFFFFACFFFFFFFLLYFWPLAAVISFAVVDVERYFYPLESINFCLFVLARAFCNYSVEILANGVAKEQHKEMLHRHAIEKFGAASLDIQRKIFVAKEASCSSEVGGHPSTTTHVATATIRSSATVQGGPTRSDCQQF